MATNFVQQIATQPDVIAAVGETLDNFVYDLPQPTLAGNSLICEVEYPSGVTPAITDDKSNSWPTSGAAGTVTADAGAGNMVLQVFVLSNAITGTSQIKVNFGGHPQTPVRVRVIEVPYTVGAIQGSNKAAAVNSSGTVSPGSFTPTASNCLVLAFMGNSNTAGTTNPTLISAAAGYALNDADISWNTGAGTTSASQWLLQGAAAPTTASFSLTAGGTDTYNVVALALSTATPGTLPAAGIHIDRLLYFSTNSTPASWKFQIPSSGNLGVLATPVDLTGTGTVTATDSDSVVWTVKSGGAGVAPIFLFRANYAPSATRTITLDYTGHTGLNQDFRYYDISGAATSPFDVFAFLGSTDVSNVNSIASAPSITPTTLNGLVIACMQVGQGPVIAVTSPAGATYDEPAGDTAQIVGGISSTTLTVASTTWGTLSVGAGAGDLRGSGVTVGTTPQSGTGPFTVQPSQTVSAGTTMNQHSSDVSNVNWGNGLAHYYNPNTNPISFNWSISNQPSNSITASAIAFKAAPSGAASYGEKPAASLWARPGTRLTTPASKLRSVLDTGTTPPPFIDQTAGRSPRLTRLGTPISRLRSAVLDTGTTPPPFIDQTAGPRPRRLKLGTPVSLLRGAVLDTGTTQFTTGLLSAFGVSVSSATFDMTSSPGFLTVNAVSASAAAVPPAGGVGLTGASASAAAVPPAGGVGATGVSAATAAVGGAGGIGASGVSASTATVDFTGSPGFMNLPGASASVAIFPLSPGAFFISASGASASTATFDMTGSPGFLTASAASASAAVFPLSGGIGMVGVSASGVVFQLSGGISLFGVAGTAAAFPLAGGVSFNGASASAAIYTAVGVAANSIFLTGVAGSAGHLTLIGVSTVQNLHEIGLGGLMLRLGGRVGGN